MSFEAARDRAWRAVPGVMAAAVVLAPYATVGFPFRRALHAQAGLITIIVLLAAAVVVFRKAGRREIRRFPRPLMVGLALWSATAIVGCAVGLFLGNEPEAVAGQLLSMGLLPLGAVAGLLAVVCGCPRCLAVGIVAGAVAGVLVHFIAWAAFLASGKQVLRFYLSNGVSMVGAALLALLLAIGLACGAGRRAWLGALACTVSLLLFIVGSGVRSLWAVTPLGLVVLAILWPRARRTQAFAVLASAGLAPALVVGGVAAALEWWERPRPNTVPDTSFCAPFWRHPKGVSLVVLGTGANATPALRWAPEAGARRTTVTWEFPIEAGVYRLQTSVSGLGQGQALVGLTWVDAQGKACGSVRLPIPESRGWQVVESSFLVPDGAVAARIYVGRAADASGVWYLRAVRLEHLGVRRFPLLLSRQLSFLRSRTAAGLAMAAGDPTADSSIAIRVRESRRLWELFRGVPLPRKLLGHGLGARFQIDRLPDSGHLIPDADPNYIHNFYLFLLFKLGLTGGAAALAALALWVSWTCRATRVARRARERALLAAATAAWVAYVLWNVACPEILDFRMAALWGLLLALSATGARGEELRHQGAIPGQGGGE